MRKFVGAILVVVIVFIVSFMVRRVHHEDSPVFVTDPVRPVSAPQAILLGQKIDINSATKDDLEALPGIGPSLAERIVRYRTAHGRFKSLDELDNVSGIGPKTVERLKEFLK
jgi:comEA protein